MRTPLFAAFLLLASFGLHGSPSAKPASSDSAAPPELAISSLVRGNTATMKVGNLLAMRHDREVWYAYSLDGPGPSQHRVGHCGVMAIDLDAAITVLGSSPVAAGDTGTFIHFDVPRRAPLGHPVWFQAIDLDNCALTNNVVEKIQ